jgi:hypothetical protein
MPWSATGGQEEAIPAIRDTVEMPALHPQSSRKLKRPDGYTC